MARETQFYSQKGHSFLIDGVAAVDLMDGDSISFARGGDIASLTKGTDKAVLNLANDPTCTMTVRLKQTSVTNDYFKSILAGQEADPPIFPNLTGTIVDGVNVIHRASVGAIQSAASLDTGGPAMTGREWVFVFTQIDQDNG